MIPADIPTREVGLVISIAIFIVASAGILVIRQLNGSTPPSLKYGLGIVWLFALLRLYSASSFVWGSTAKDAGLISVLRLGVLAVLTVILIVLMAVVVFFARQAYGRKRTSRKR